MLPWDVPARLRPLVEKTHRERMEAPPMPAGSNVPRTVYHYTTAAGLIGILESHTLWATDVRSFHDRDETTYGLQVFHAVAAEMLPEASGRLAGDFLAFAAKAVNPFGLISTGAAVSFCGDGDSLGHWREYSGAGTGYAVGFDVLRMMRAARWMDGLQPRPEGSILFDPVIYDRRQQRAWARRILRHCLGHADGFARALGRATPRARHQALRPLLMHLFQRLSTFLLLVKNPLFASENEWRLTYQRSLSDLDAIRFRPTRLGVTPYVPLSFVKGEATQRLPIRRIVQGPVVRNVSDLTALRLLAQKTGYRRARLSSSKLTLR